MQIKVLLVTLLSMFLCTGFGCSTQAQDAENQVQETFSSVEVPALVIHLSNESAVESLNEIQNTIATLLKQKAVLIADTAFTKSSYLTLERVAHKTAHGQLVMGRSTEVPFSLRLVIKGNSCFIKDEKSGQSLALSITQCKAE